MCDGNALLVLLVLTVVIVVIIVLGILIILVLGVLSLVVIHIDMLLVSAEKDIPYSFRRIMNMSMHK